MPENSAENSRKLAYDKRLRLHRFPRRGHRKWAPLSLSKRLVVVTSDMPTLKHLILTDCFAQQARMTYTWSTVHATVRMAAILLAIWRLVLPSTSLLSFSLFSFYTDIGSGLIWVIWAHQPQAIDPPLAEFPLTPPSTDSPIFWCQSMENFPPFLPFTQALPKHSCTFTPCK